MPLISTKRTTRKVMALAGLQQGWQGGKRHGGNWTAQWLLEMRFCSQVIRRSRIKPMAPIQITPSTISET